MKRIILTFSMGLALFTVNGQQQQGRVLYERTVKMRAPPMRPGNEMEQMMPRTRKDKVEVLFGNGQSLCRPVEEDMPEDFASEGGGMRVTLMVGGMSNVTYMNFPQGRMVELREFGGRDYIISDSIRKQQWKLTGDTATILNYPCQQAITQTINKRPSVRMENGELKRSEVTDTSNVIVWFTPAIPVPAGPEHQGQLPGLILAMEIGDRMVYKAVEVSDKADLKEVKAPTKGKKVTAEEFAKERDKLMEEMQRNGGGRGRPIRIGG